MKIRTLFVLGAFAIVGCSRGKPLADPTLPGNEEELLDEDYYSPDPGREWSSPVPSDDSFWLGKFRGSLPSASRFYQVVDDQVPLHARPDSGSTVVETLPKGSLIEVEFIQKGWARVTGYYVQLKHITAAKNPRSARFK